MNPIDVLLYHNWKIWAIVVQVDVIGKERTLAISYYGRQHAYIYSEEEKTEDRTLRHTLGAGVAASNWLLRDFNGRYEEEPFDCIAYNLTCMELKQELVMGTESNSLLRSSRAIATKCPLTYALCQSFTQIARRSSQD